MIMEEQVEPKKLGRKKKEDGAKTFRVELRLTAEQKELLDLAVSKKYKGTQTDVLLSGLHNYCNHRPWFTPEMYKKYWRVCYPLK
jgi:hypothetical protein